MGDSELDAAKQEALDEVSTDLEEAADEIVETEEEIEEVVEEEIEVEEELPTDHKERSNLGRKVSALFEKADKTEEVLGTLAKVIERLTPQEQDETLDEYVTKKDLMELQQRPAKEAQQYEKDFKNTYFALCKKEGLSEDEVDGVSQILLEKYNQRIMDDGKLDGALNFEKAKNDYFASKKKTPLQSKRASGVVKTQKVKPKETKLKKLDAASESFLRFIERTDGAEAALKRRKSI